MNVATLLFTYNRSYHTEQVLVALKHSIVQPQRLFVFQDGLRVGTDSSEWKKVNKLIRSIDWCDKEIIVSKYNMGLAQSIVSGINYVFEEYDAIIVIEDDCVPNVAFIGFMQQCFEKYNNDKRIYSISGYAWPIELQKDEYDVYGCGRISSWGWGTWKDRWEQRKTDSGFIERIKNDQDKSRYLAMWGNDCERMLLDRIAGNNDSWAIYWALYVIENNGICINPYESLIQNIGMDGSGVNCGVTERYVVKMSNELRKDFKLPVHINILHSAESAFADFLGSHTAANVDIESKQHILVYGMGTFFFQYEKEINELYYIEAFIDRNKKGWYAGKRVIRPNQIADYNYSNILIMVQDIQQCIGIVKELISYNVSPEKIILGHCNYGRYSKEIDQIIIQQDGSLSIKFEDVSIKLETKDEFEHVCEVFLNQIYNYCINNRMKDIIFDIEMNIGDVTAYFAKQDNVEKVYGYEASEKAYSVAKENLKDFLYTGKAEIFNYGIGYENIIGMAGYNERNEQVEERVVKRASEVIRPIIEKYSKHNMVLKMNCNGEECNILRELLQNELIGKFKLIIIEWHYKRNDTILDYLGGIGFSWWHTDESKDMGLVYAYKG